MISSLLFQPPPPTYIHPSRHFWLDTSYGTRIPAFFIERPNAQGDVLMITSWGAYERHIALPLLEARASWVATQDATSWLTAMHAHFSATPMPSRPTQGPTGAHTLCL